MRRTEYDNPWKEILERFLQPLLQLTLTHLHQLIDWSQPVLSLQNELQRLLPTSQTPTQIVDKLFQVHFKNGTQQLVLIHLEVQAQPESHFNERMFDYFARTWLHFRLPVVSAAIFADDDPHWFPTVYTREIAGCRLQFEYLGVKLLALDEAELERSTNPVALLILAHRKALATRGRPELRLSEKMELTRRLLGMGYTVEEALQVFRLVDWLMVLPEQLERVYEAYLAELEAQGTPYLSSFERSAIRRGLEQGLEEGRQQGRAEGRREGLQEGLRQAILQVLGVRFGEPLEGVGEQLERVGDTEVLQALCGLAARVGSVAEFLQALQPYLSQQTEAITTENGQDREP